MKYHGLEPSNRREHASESETPEYLDVSQITVKIIRSEDRYSWDDYVHSRSDSNIYQLYDWKTVIENAYKHKTYYLMATTNQIEDQGGDETVVGVLPLVHMKSLIFGNKLVSIPFFDMGGILSANDQATSALLEAAVALGHSLNVNSIEFRHARSVQRFDRQDDTTQHNSARKPFNSPFRTEGSKIICLSATNKVRMLLNLPGSSEALMNSFKAKLRSQIKKPIKEGLKAVVGGQELLDDFYSVFSINMRDLGSPVHSKRIIFETLSAFHEKTRVVAIYHDQTPVAASIVIGFNSILENPWASALRKYSRMAPNMLLYWTMLEYACDKGYTWFDFGRSSPDEGTFKFKKQWGAEPDPLHWTEIKISESNNTNDESEKARFSKAIQYWQKLPVPVSRFLGPMIRKHIGL